MDNYQNSVDQVDCMKFLDDHNHDYLVFLFAFVLRYQVYLNITILLHIADAFSIRHIADGRVAFEF